jgi:dTMP kinase
MTAQRSRGHFISFEGGEGSGKSTQIRRLAVLLERQGLTVIQTREPGGSPMGERIRGLLLDPDAKLDATTQIFLFCAARHDHVVALIEPALQRGDWVLCDRFADSTRAYQGAAGEIPADLVRTFEKTAIGRTVPDLTLILDITPEKGLARANRRRGTADKADAFEASDLAFHQRVREGYLDQARKEPERCKVIDADQSEHTVAQAIAELMAQRFGLNGAGAVDG